MFWFLVGCADGERLPVEPVGDSDKTGSDDTSPGDTVSDDTAVHDTAVDDTAADTGAGHVRAGLAGLDDLGFRSVVVVHVDTLRADRLPFYGAARDTMPLSSELDWLVVDGLYAPTSWTIPSTISLLTGLDDLHHGVTHMTPTGAMNAGVEVPTFASAFRDAGVHTLVLSGNQALPLVNGVFEGFEAVDLRYVEGQPTELEGEAENALRWLDTLGAGEPFFVFLQPMDVHSPYRPQDAHLGVWSDVGNLPFSLTDGEEAQLVAFQAAYEAAPDDAAREALVEALRAIYDEDILGVDEGLAHLVAGLEERGLAEDTLIVFAADHGETLTEENGYRDEVFFGHGAKARQELLRVPLMFRHPRLPAQHVECLAANVDVMPTVSRALGIAGPAGVDGQPLQDGCRSIVRASVYQSDRDDPVINELLVSDGAAALRWACSWRRTWRYDLDADPAGIEDVPEEAFAALPALDAEMRVYLADIRAAFGPLECAVE